ncbi:hypothetical protein [Halobaculum marinum]|uniref:Uncharacterized protein n=1 Tax=Halobaculum marinum TaxID=3031996 RepID=A0ABD5X0F4_9EURY|nr:hypothetical protein [Halobaculum sp. DT55]
MDRRRVLAGAASVGTFALAGCTGAAGDGSDGDSEETTDDTETGGAGSNTSEGGDGESDGPSITDTQFERLGDADESGGRGSIRFSDATVTCAGVIQGRNGCMEAALDAATYDASADELRVRVTTVDEGGDACTQQIVDREYEATVTFEGGLPGRVVLEHEWMDGVYEVAVATR